MGGQNKRFGFRPKISTKIVFYFLTVALIPPIVVSIILISGARTQLLQGAAAKQESFAADVSHQVDSYLAANISQLSLTVRHYLASPGQVDQSLNALFKENPNLLKVEVFIREGKKKRTATLLDGEVKFTSAGIATDDTTLDQLANKSQSLQVTRNLNNTPHLAISMPIKAQGGAANTVIGGIVGHFKIDALLPEQKNTKGYAYVVDDLGNLVHHPDQNFMSTHADLKNVDAVSNFLGGNTRTEQTVSEADERVISAVRETKDGWGVVAEEPTSSVYAGLNDYVQFAGAVIVGTIGVSALAGLYFSSLLIRPIKHLVIGARKLLQNNLTKPIKIKTKDELQELAEIFNNLGNNINNFVSSLKDNNCDLAYEQSNLRSIINSVNDGVVAVNRRGEIISVNAPAVRMVSHIPYDVKGKLLSEIFPWTHDSNPLKLDLGTPGFHTYSDIVLAKGESVTYMDLMVEVVDRDDSDVAAIITIHDQTSSRELNFMKLDFVAIAAHELRTPLTVISGYLDILNREAIHSLSLENLEDLQRAIIGTKQLRELINKLLNVARIERGDMEIFLEKLNVTKLIATSVEEHQPIAAQKEQVLSYTSNTDSTVYAPADAASITEVLNNLIGNAIKYTPRGGQIYVNIIASAEEVYIEVADNGPGIPEELREKLFSKFYRAERSMISGTRGTGLGLFISKTIVELQRGTIGIRPDDGIGSKFYFTLPIYNSERDDELIANNISRGRHGWFKKRTDN